MTNYVIDASVAIKWLIWEEGTDQALELLNQLTTFYVPNIFLFEIDSVVTKRVRKREMDKEDALLKREQFRKFPFRLIPYKEIEEFAFQLAIEFSISHFDACYLAVAIDYEGVLYTADKRMFNGMRSTQFSNYIHSIC